MDGDRMKREEFKRRVHDAASVNVAKKFRNEREQLPIFQHKEKLVQAVRDNQVLIVIGPTGCGKTTQIPQYLLECGIVTSKILCTQPRRISAIAAAKRVAQEFGSRVGDQVGYRIRFDSRPGQLIDYVTDGIMVKDCINDPSVNNYQLLLIDEAHDRQINTDLCLGLAKHALRVRPELKVIVTSATLNHEKFSDYFDQAPVFTIPERLYPVKLLYHSENLYEHNYVEKCVEQALDIHQFKPTGDILVFLTGKEEVERACDLLEKRINRRHGAIKDFCVYPLHGSMPLEEQDEIITEMKPNTRKFVFATNIAETSITIDGICYVVDCGFVKMKERNEKTGIDCLNEKRISQDQAEQRAGRAGRTAPGTCYRMYPEVTFSVMRRSQVPEIQRDNLESLVINLMAIGIKDPVSFDYMDPPKEDSLKNALKILREMEAINDQGALTDKGRKLSEFPLEPKIANLLYVSVEKKCSEEILAITALMSVQNIFFRPKKHRMEADGCKEKFHHKYGDHLTYLNLYREWIKQDKSAYWCKDNFVRYEKLTEAEDIRSQLADVLQKLGLNRRSAGSDHSRLVETIVQSFRFNRAIKVSRGKYRLMNGEVAFVHPSSALFKAFPPPERLVYSEVMRTSKPYMRDITRADDHETDDIPWQSVQGLEFV